uniref:Peptidase M24 domain-containing protein n=1 Tax=Sus scrofa TaxID=9823 RepID=A0A8D1GJV6_PIG
MLGKDEHQEQTIAKDLVVTKYKIGGEGRNRVLGSLVEASCTCVSVLSLCEKSNKEKEMKKVLAFPTSFSVNICVCHFPLKSDQDYILKEGDLVKIDLGVHVDGFITNVAHTFVVDVALGTQGTGQNADVIKAAHLCAEAALCLVKPGNQNTQMTKAWNKVAHSRIPHSFNCTPIEGMLSHQLKQHVIDRENTIIKNTTDLQKKDHEKMDVLVSSGEGKAKDAGQRAIIYNRDPSKQYGLKMKTSSAFFSEAERHFDVMPFTLRLPLTLVLGGRASQPLKTALNRREKLKNKIRNQKDFAFILKYY